MKKIEQFRGEYAFLSNFYELPTPLYYEGVTYLSTEAAFQAAKCSRWEDRKQFSKMAPNDAKRLGRKIQLRPDWEQVKIRVMRDLLYAKFQNNDELCDKLLSTGDAELVEGNTWHDTFWGVCNGVGENNLGKLLMEVRATIRFRKKAYNRYQLHWMLENDVALSDVLTWMKEDVYSGLQTPLDPVQGYNLWYSMDLGTVWVSFRQFMECEYRDIEYMKDVITIDMWDFYQMDVTRLSEKV